MMDYLSSWFVWFVGIPPDELMHVTSVSVSFRGGLSAGWAIFLALALLALVWWSYRVSPRDLPKWRFRTLVALRVIFFALMLMLLMRPVLELTVEGTVRRVLLVMIDDSSSMQIQDRRLTPTDLSRAGIATGDATRLNENVGGAAGDRLNTMSRRDVVEAALKNQRLDLIRRFGDRFDLSFYAFGPDLRELPTPSDKAGTTEAGTEVMSAVKGDLPTTNIGDNVRDLVERKRGQPLAGLLLITDGANNAGTSPMSAASFAGGEDLPLYVYGVGVTSPRDVIVSTMLTQDVAFVDDELEVSVRVRGRDMAERPQRLILEYMGKPVADQVVEFPDDSEQTIRLSFIPDAVGEGKLKAYVTARPDEASIENNVVEEDLRVIDSKMKVLLVERLPRWEFRYLEPLLLRDRRVDLDIVLFEGAPELWQAPNSPYLEDVPTDRDELFKYDVIILGDVRPEDFGNEAVEALSDFVSKAGGGLIMMAGKSYAPWSYVGTALEKMLPVEFDATAGKQSAVSGTNLPIGLEVTALGAENPMMRLSDNTDDQPAYWRSLPPVYWVAEVTRSKPGAQVMLVDPSPARATRFGSMPVLAMQQYGLGQVLWVGTDNFWRWRSRKGSNDWAVFWSTIVQRMALPRLLGSAELTQLNLDKEEYVAGNRVTVFARLYREGFTPLEDSAVTASYEVSGVSPEEGGGKREFTLQPIEGQPGAYRGEFVASAAGEYRIWTDRDPDVDLTVSVTKPRFELGETAMNEDLLKEMAEASGGKLVREENLYSLPDEIGRNTERVESPRDVELWSTPFFFTMLLGVLSAEWILRKMVGLK